MNIHEERALIYHICLCYKSVFAKYLLHKSKFCCIVPINISHLAASSSRKRQEVLSQTTTSPLLSQSSRDKLPQIKRSRPVTKQNRSRNDVINDTDSDSDSEWEEERSRYDKKSSK